ncbi:hypothetical protein [Streptomyces sp. SID4982]|uniref:hypothetical protein n=1 Tax=Streptomyces sp. SID4982 TaxID=2690291 RepID=UPI00137129AD|nr:hypothetical protein [Streptomyces sp. SID4982]MYS15160.1 hypothetical protein [Streptomyces sp. SID4982]
MPDPSTTRLGLYKSKSDGSELVNYTQDIGQNLDKLDLAAGFQAVTSTTRPAAPYSGKPIFETNTSYRSYFSNGTSPASASWVEIPNSSGTFGGNLTLAASSSLSIGAATLTRSSGGSLNSNTNYQRTGSASTDVAYSTLVTSDTFDRARIYTDGKLEMGPGNAARDVNLYRSAANTLTTDSNFVAANLFATGWKNLASYGSFQNSATAGSPTPQVQDVTICGLKLRFFQGVVNLSGVGTGGYAFFQWNAGYLPTYERDWGVGGQPSSASYRAYWATSGAWGITGQAASQTVINLDQFSPIINPPGTL